MGMQRKVVVLMTTLAIAGYGTCSSISLLSLSPSVHPTNVNQALKLFDNATHNGNFRQAQRALHWINANYLEVLRSPQLAELSSECLMQILSQPCFVDEIEVFRAVRRIVEAPGSRHRAKAAMLYSTLRLASIDIDKLNNEVVSSGLLPHHSIIDALLEVAQGAVPMEYARQTLGNVSVRRLVSGNILGVEYGAKMITDRSLYSLSNNCSGSNPLISSIRAIETWNQNCWIETKPEYFTTIHLGGEFLLYRIYTLTPSSRRCPNLRLEISVDNRVYTHVGTISMAYSGDSINFMPRRAAYIRYRSDPCTEDGKPVTGLRLNAIGVYLSDYAV